MAKKIKITIENKLVLEKRDMNIYHHSTRSAHLISYNSSLTLPFRTVVEEDYLHVSIVCGPGDLKSMIIVNLPGWVNFEFSSGKDVVVTHLGERTILKIPPGPPRWQLKMTRSASAIIPVARDRIIISDDQLNLP